jgi:hypothetical protein
MYEDATFDGSFCTFDSDHNHHKKITFDYQIRILPSSDIQSIPVIFSYQSGGVIVVGGESTSIQFVASKNINRTEFKSKIVPFWIGSGTVFEMKSKNKLMVAPWLVGDPRNNWRILK